MRLLIFGGALSLLVSAAVAQDFGGQEEQDYAGQLWQNMQDRNLAATTLSTPFPIQDRIRMPMKHRPRPPEQDDLLRPRLVDKINQRHELVKLAALIDWEVFDQEWAGIFPSGKGRPATEPRLVAGLLYLQHAYRLSDEAVVARWAENPYSAPYRRDFLPAQAAT